MEIRVLREEDLEQAWELDRVSFHVPAERREGFLRLHVPERTVGAFEAGRLVAMVGAHAFGQYFGGRRVPMAGVASVAVVPDRRGAGLAGELLAVALREARARGECLSSLFPATTRLYRGAGYEVAGHFVWRRVAPQRLLGAPRPERARVRPADPERDLPAIRACYDRVAPSVNGFLDRGERWWAKRVEGWRGEGLFVAEGDAGAVEGYVAYRTLDGAYSALGGPFSLSVDECVAETSDAARALWRLVGSWSSQADTVFLRGGAEDPLLLLLPEQGFEPIAEIRWMSRVVDAPRAVAERGYAAGLALEVPFTLRDDAVPENAGRWRLVVKDGRGALERAPDADLALDAGAFASLYTGWATCAGLARAGRLEGGTPAERAALGAAFAGPVPWLLDEF